MRVHLNIAIFVSNAKCMPLTRKSSDGQNWSLSELVMYAPPSLHIVTAS